MGTWNNVEARRKNAREYQRRRRLEDPEWAERQRVRDRARNRTRIRVFNRPPETGAAIRANHRAKKAGVTGRLTANDIRALWDRQPVCVICGEGRGVDHIVALSNGGPNIPDNIQNLCPPCNRMKYWRQDRSSRLVATC